MKCDDNENKTISKKKILNRRREQKKSSFQMKTMPIENDDDTFTQKRKIEKGIKALQIKTITINCL